MSSFIGTLPVATAIVLIGLGAMVAADWRPGLTLVLVIAAVCGLLVGFLNGVGLAATGASVLTVVGTACAIFVIVALIAGQLVSIRWAWVRIVVRVGGSWIAAIGLLMLGWAVR